MGDLQYFLVDGIQILASHLDLIVHFSSLKHELLVLLLFLFQISLKGGASLRLL